MPEYPHEGTMKGYVDDAGQNFFEEGKDRPCELFADAMQAASEEKIDLSEHAGHRVNVSYVGRQEYAAWECDVGTRD